MISGMYRKGYEAGYRMGVVSGLNGSNARAVMEHDLEYVYGTLCLVLKRKHDWEDERIQDLVSEVQEEWSKLEENHDATGMRMADLVEKETGVQLKQVVDAAIDAGEDEYLGG